MRSTVAIVCVGVVLLVGLVMSHAFIVGGGAVWRGRDDSILSM